MGAVATTMLKHQNRSNRQDEDQTARQLIREIAETGGREAFAALFDALAPRIKSFIMRKGAPPEMAEDLVQETMISVWTKARLYDPSKGSAITWVFTIARNLRIDRLRRESSVPFSELGDYDAPDGQPASDDVLGSKQDARRVKAALQDIPAEQQQILLLSYVDDLPQSEIATRLNLPLGTVKSRMRLAYRHMRKTLEASN
jgi:RNA polymerase sigma-70 factor, ECF subfamily